MTNDDDNVLTAIHIPQPITTVDLLEALIDAQGLDNVLSIIREICYAKANHIAVAEQDVTQAKAWLAKGIRVNQAAQGVRV